MNEDPMNNVNAPSQGTPLSVFQDELSKFKGGKKQKKFLYVILPIIIVVLIVGGYFIYHSIKINQEAKQGNEALLINAQRNQQVIDKMQEDGEAVPANLVNTANKVIESAKLNSEYGLSREEIEKLKQLN